MGSEESRGGGMVGECSQNNIMHRDSKAFDMKIRLQQGAV